jgi:ribose transport system ATP-binding protein
MTEDATSILDARGVAKRFGAVVALSDASLRVGRGQIVALMGANGAGKSTFVKILTGALKPDAGQVRIRGKESIVHSPAGARRSGLVPVYQEPSLIPDLTVAGNLRLGDTPVEAFRYWVEALGITGLRLDDVIGRLPLATLRKVVRAEADAGRAVIYISHRFTEIAAICDRATVLRDGQTVGDLAIEPGIEEQVVELMLGGSVSSAAGPRAVKAGASGTPRLRVRGLKTGSRLADVSLDLHKGEVLGVVALEGQGQDELFDILAGNRRASAGTVEIDGRPVSFHHPADAIAAGLTLVPGDRAHALFMHRSVRENIAVPLLARLRTWGAIPMREEAARVTGAIERLQVDTRAQGEVRRLSGGNQQKVTIARWIAKGVETLLLFDPTRGIDIRTKRQIYALVRELAGQGAAVLYYTSELAEVPLACDRAVVIFNGRVVDAIDAADADEANLMRAAYGLTEKPAVPA